MNAKKIIACKNRSLGVCLAAVMVWAALTPIAISNAQTVPGNLSSDLQQIVKLAQAHMSDDVILGYIKQSGKTYYLSADDMLSLNSRGVSQAVISALMQTSSAAPAASAIPSAPNAAPSPAATPAPAPACAPAPAPFPAPVSVSPLIAAPPPGLADNFATDAGLNPSVWMMQTPLLQSLAQWNSSASVPPIVSFGPAGMQMSGVSGPGQFAGIQSVGSYSPPFTMTATASGLAERGIPFEVYLVSPDLRQWLSVAGHLGGAGGPRESIGFRSPFGGFRMPLGGGPSPEHGVWANWTGSAQPISALGNKIYTAPIPSVPYTIAMTVGADGVASVSLQDPSGVSLAALNAMPVGAGPFNVVLASRGEGPTFASWQAVQLTPLAPEPVAAAPPPETPTLDYFQAHLTPYGQWIDVPGIGPAWVPAEANNLDWRPYFDAGHWEYTEAGWYWQSDYPWGDIAFHYGRWIRNDLTGGRWAWVPAYDWAPSWVAWREGEGGLGWAPLPWGVEYRAGLGLYWHGAAVVTGVDFGLGFDAFVFVGPDHFWGGDYRRFAFDRIRAREFFDHSQFRAGYRVEGGRLLAEGLGRDRIREITRHEIVQHKATEMRLAEEHADFSKRTEEHRELARAPERAPAQKPTEISRSSDLRGIGTGAPATREQAEPEHEGRFGNRSNNSDNRP